MLIELFPVDINTADREMVLRVPGIGLKTANRIVPETIPLAQRLMAAHNTILLEEPPDKRFEPMLDGAADAYTYPHTRDELSVGSATDQLSLDDCRRLYPRVRRASITASREIVARYLGSRW
ncbi:MAG: hypothetical protein WBY88_14325 [Desulfosarcina sp.]